MAVLGYDPLYYVLEARLAEVHSGRKVIFRTVVCALAVKEGTETHFLICASLISMLRSTNQVLIHITNITLTTGIQAYKQLQVVAQTSQCVLRMITGVLMSVGFVVGISGNYGIISGARILPTTLYACLCNMQIALYIVVSMTLPQIIECYNLSNEMTSKIWLRSFIFYTKTSCKFSCRILQKTLRSLMPITYYYGTARFDQGTKTSYYVNILFRTIDLVLLM